MYLSFYKIREEVPRIVKDGTLRMERSMPVLPATLPLVTAYVARHNISCLRVLHCGKSAEIFYHVQ